MSKVRFQRATYVVRDIERALEFYRDFLAFRWAYIMVSELESYSYPVFEIPRDRAIRFATLSTKEQPRVMALTEVPGGLEELPMPRRCAVVIEIEDIDGVVEASRKAGLKVYEEEHLVTQDGREGREVGIVDRDGNLVVIYWITQHPE